jgi:hypothetical protein
LTAYALKIDRLERKYIMEIIRGNIDTNNKYEVYKLTKSAGEMVQNAPDGISIPVASWLLYNDPKEGKDGTKKDNIILSFVDNDGVKYSTVSATFQREFNDIVELMGSTPFALLIKHGTTKAGKPFVTCELDCDYRM